MGFGGGGGGNKGPRGDINVTPLVDVVLVLLIIFLVTMPIMMKQITVEIPRSADDEIPAEAIAPQIVVELKTGGRLLLDAQEINRVDLAEKLRERLERRSDKNKIVFFGADPLAKYGDAVSIVDTIKGAGALKITIKTQDEKKDGEATEP